MLSIEKILNKLTRKNNKINKIMQTGKKININDTRVNDVFSEISHYVVTEINSKNTIVKVQHLQSGREIELTSNYVEDLLKTGDQYSEEVTVGKEDKFWTAKQIEAEVKAKRLKEGDVNPGDLKVKGIKTLWQDIHSSQVFSVCFKKKDSPLTKKKYNALKSELIDKFTKTLEMRNVTNKDILAEVTELIDNPILQVEEGEDRVLRGYKIQFVSEDGHYDCIDMDASSSYNQRQVNLNTIKWLVFDGIKYIVE